jgi:hypothetical protein
MKIPWTSVLVGALLTTTMITTGPTAHAQPAGAVWDSSQLPATSTA